VSSQDDDLSGREVIFEFLALGDSVRVAAVDVATGEEVVVTGPAATPQSDLEWIAGRKLLRRLIQLEEVVSEKQKPRTKGRGFYA
jgi:hypothetical protein